MTTTEAEPHAVAAGLTQPKDRIADAERRSWARGLVDTWHVATVMAHRDLLKQAARPGPFLVQLVQLAFFVVLYAVGIAADTSPVDGLSFAAFALPGIMTIQAVNVAIMAGVVYAMDARHGTLRQLLLAPSPPAALPLGKAAATAILGAVETILALILAPLCGVTVTFVGAALTLAVVCAATVVFAMLGLALAMRIKQVETLQAILQLALFPLLFFSGSVFSASSGPGWLQTVAHLNPITYIADLVRWSLFSSSGYRGASPAIDAGVLIGLGLLAVIVTERGRRSRA